MHRLKRLVNAFIAAALLAAAFGFHAITRGQQAAMIDDYCQNRLKQVEQSARDAQDEFHSIADALRFAARLIQTAPNAADRTRELAAYLAVVRQYRMINVYDGAGRLTLSVADPMSDSAPLDPWRFTELMAEGARKTALQAPGEIFTSRVLSVGKGWFQAFGLAFRPGSGQRDTSVVVILVDHHIPFEREINRTTESRSRLILLDDYGQPAPDLTPDLLQMVHDVYAGTASDPALRELIVRMRQRQMGTVQIGTSHHFLGLGAPDIVAAYAPIPARHGGHWTIARLTDVELLRGEVSAVALRWLLGYVLCAGLLLGARTLALDAARRSAEVRERLRQAEQLAHMHEKTNKIIDNIPGGVMSISSDGRISALNRWLRDRVPASALGHGLRQAFPEAPAPLVARLDALLAAALAESKVHSLFGERLWLFGEEGQYTLHAVPLEPRFADSRVVLVIEDLSEVGALASQLLRAEKLATVGVLAAGIAHEIGTPLGIVRGRAEYLMGKLGAGHPQASGAGVIVDQIDLVSRTLRQLLDFARVKAASLRPVSLRPVSHAVAELLRFEASRRHAEIHVAVAEDLPQLAADPDQLQQVLVNLVINACDAVSARAPGAAGPGRVDLRGELPSLFESGEMSTETPRARSGRSLRGGDQRVQIVISDNGCGIPKENRDQVFDPFFTTKKRGQGTGLGLSIVAQIVRNHGGQIEIDSEVGRGTRMILKWPTARAAGLISEGTKLSEVSLRPLGPGDQSDG